MASNNSVIGIARFVLYFLAVIFAVLVLYKYFTSGEGPSLSTKKVPKELTINYVNSDFRFNIDEEDAVAILSNPRRYSREFNQLIYELNLSILNHVAKRMNLEDNLKGKLRSEYEKHHEYLKDLYFQDFIATVDTSAADIQTWYDNHSKTAVEVLHEVASKYTCFFVNQIISGLIPTDEGRIYAKGRKVDTPCGLAIKEALRPFIKRMEDRAAIADFESSRGVFQERVERVIGELATYEFKDKKGINKKMQTKLFGVGVSTSDIEITAISILKVGFRLNDFFDVRVNSKRREMIITLPEPTIVSHEVYPKVDRLSIGWLREVKNDNFNETFDLLRDEFRKDAISENVMGKAKEQAVHLMATIFDPVVKTISASYEVKVRFKKVDKLDLDDNSLSTRMD